MGKWAEVKGTTRVGAFRPLPHSISRLVSIRYVHKYLDFDNSGTNAECTTNNIDNAWAPLAPWLRCNGRQAFNTETGGGNVASCEQFMCEQVAFQKANSDVFLGYVGWAAGSFYTGYVLGEVPTQNADGSWTDTPLVAKCLAPNASQ